ncbi:ABC transporter substrate-binding protein [Niveispirillum sp. KHB5.9]|uniref:ABC transporter substrate-binding protein n=1 Tax=Niveispirillum sp. KHB5.9 TaxID=3400269 RepID=UPI003A8358AC
MELRLLAPRFRSWMGLLLLAGQALLITAGAEAAELRIGLMNLARSADPHLGANRADYLLHDQIYEGLAGVDAAFRPVPRLAERWEQTADGAWLFHLRRGVRFQNGQPFTARDVLYSFCRVGKVGLEPRALAARLAGIIAVEAPDPFTIRIRHEMRVAIFPSDMASVPIVAAPADLNITFTPGGCAGDRWGDSDHYADPGFGTGPFRLARFAADEMVVERNRDYWGSPAGWDHVRLIHLTEKERVTAMVEGRIDILDNPSLESLPFFARRPDLVLVEGPSSGVTYLQSNQRAADGPDGPNRFRDRRVRRALLLAIPGRLLADRIVPGFGNATGQMAMKDTDAHVPDIPDDEHDLAEARRLLAEAGFAGGFDTTLMVTPMQSKVGDAIAHFLAMVGVRAKVQVEPMDRYIERLRTGEFELFYGGWIYNPANMPASLLALLGRGVEGTGRGAHNYGGYCNADIDRQLVTALGEADAGRRNRLLQDAARALHDDVAWIPVMHAEGRWLVRAGIRLEPRLDRMLLAREITAEPATR